MKNLKAGEVVLSEFEDEESVGCRWRLVGGEVTKPGDKRVFPYYRVEQGVLLDGKWHWRVPRAVESDLPSLARWFATVAMETERAWIAAGEAIHEDEEELNLLDLGLNSGEEVLSAFAESDVNLWRVVGAEELPGSSPRYFASCRLERWDGYEWCEPLSLGEREIMQMANWMGINSVEIEDAMMEAGQIAEA